MEIKVHNIIQIEGMYILQNNSQSFFLIFFLFFIRQVFDRFEKSIENKEITYYDYQDFNNISEIGSGGFASVYTASWKNTQSKFAIKKFKISITKEVMNEVC